MSLKDLHDNLKVPCFVSKEEWDRLDRLQKIELHAFSMITGEAIAEEIREKYGDEAEQFYHAEVHGENE